MINQNNLCCFFPEAVTYPNFFNTNLTDTNRVLKIVTGAQCWARAYYYQLMKLIFQIQIDEENNVDYGLQFINFAKQVARKLTNPSKKQKMDHSTLIIQNFLKNMINNSNIDFQNYINENPIIDESFIYLLNGFVTQAGMERVSVQEKIKYLTNIFQMQIHEFDKGIKIEQSDTFLYIQNQSTIYIAFLGLSQFVEDELTVEGNQSKQDNTQEKITSSLQQKMKQAQVSKKQSEVEKFEAGANLSEKARGLEQLAKRNQKMQSVQSSVKNGRSDDSLEFTLGNKKQNVYYKPEKLENWYKMLNSGYSKQTQTVRQQNSHDYSKFKNNQLGSEQRMVHQPRQSKLGSLQSRFSRNEDIFYKPEMKSSINNPFSYKVGGSPGQESRNNKKDPLDLCSQEEKGTFYRKFTNTRILNMLPQPYRSKVKMLKNRFIGVHSRNLKTRGYQ